MLSDEASQERADDALLWSLRAADVEALRFRDGAIVFNPLSWDTHLLNESAFQILDALGRGASRPETLVQRIVGDRLSQDDPRVAQVETCLEEMESLGLVTREYVGG